MCLCGQASRSALSAGKVRMKSPIAPPRITSMRFILYCSHGPVGRLTAESKNKFAFTGHRPVATAKRSLILHKGEGEDHAAVNERGSMQTAPAKDCSRAPVNLIAKHVRDRDPKQSGNDQQISEYSYK